MYSREVAGGLSRATAIVGDESPPCRVERTTATMAGGIIPIRRRISVQTRRIGAGVLVAAVIAFGCVNAHGAASASATRSQIVEDFEEPSAAGRWTVTGGPQASAGLAEDIVHFGKHALRFHVKVDWAYGDTHFPGGWRFLTFRLASPQDWSSHDALEFFAYVPAHQPDGVLKYGVQCEGATGEPAWNSVLTPYTLPPGQWSKVSCPLNDFTVKGDRTRVLGVQFYIAEGWYKDGDDLNFYLDDFALLKSAGGTRSEIIRKAGRPLAIPAAYERQATPALYPVMLLEFIYPDTDLSARAPVRQCSLRGEGRGQVAHAGLGGRRQRDEDLKLTVSDLVQKTAARLASRHCRRPRRESVGTGCVHWEVFEPQDKILVPELLLKDDRTAFKGEGTRQAPHRRRRCSNAPFGTDIPAHTVKQLWMNFPVPEDALAGVYRGGLLWRRTRAWKRGTFRSTSGCCPSYCRRPN